MKRKNIIIIISLFVIILLFFSSILKAQWNELDNINLYKEFGKKYKFLINIEKGIKFSLIKRDAKSLIGYSFLLFFVEKMEHKRLFKINGYELLKKATQIALVKKDKKLLNIIINIWEESYWGPTNSIIANKIRENIDKSYKIYIILPQKVIYTNDTITFLVKDSIGFKIPIKEVKVYTKFGETIDNLYLAPDKPCIDVMIIKHILTNKKAKNIIFIKKTPNLNNIRSTQKKQDYYKKENRENKKVKKEEEENITKDLTDIFNSIFSKDNTSKTDNSRKIKIDPLKYYENNPEILKKILIKSEYLKVKAINELIEKVKDILKILKQFNINIDLNYIKNTIWAGIKTSEVYIYKSDPWTLHIKASVSSKWVIESLKRTFKKQGIIEIDESLFDTLKNLLPPRIEIEISLPLKEK